MESRIALLRGINVGGNKRVPMAELRALVGELGWQAAQTYIASGNVVYRHDGALGDDEAALESAIEEHFGFAVDVIVRTGERWAELAAGSAFPDAEVEREKLLHLAMSKDAPAEGGIVALDRYLKDGERVRELRDGLWIDFKAGVARSKLTPSVLNRCVGSTVTARNWRTVQKLASMLAEL